MEEQKEGLKVLTYVEFFDRWKKDKENKDISVANSRFINRAYSQTNNSLSVYEDELKFNCYFQCPDFGEHIVPEERRYIYVLKKDEWKNIKHNFSIAPNGKKRISINLNDLTVFADPYVDLSSIIEESNEEWLANKLKELMEEYEKRRKK